MCNSVTRVSIEWPVRQRCGDGRGRRRRRGWPAPATPCCWPPRVRPSTSSAATPSAATRSPRPCARPGSRPMSNILTRLRLRRTRRPRTRPPPRRPPRPRSAHPLRRMARPADDVVSPHHRRRRAAHHARPDHGAVGVRGALLRRGRLAVGDLRQAGAVDDRRPVRVLRRAADARADDAQPGVHRVRASPSSCWSWC